MLNQADNICPLKMNGRFLSRSLRRLRCSSVLLTARPGRYDFLVMTVECNIANWQGIPTSRLEICFQYVKGSMDFRDLVVG